MHSSNVTRYNHIIELFSDLSDDKVDISSAPNNNNLTNLFITKTYSLEDVTLKESIKTDNNGEIFANKFMCLINDDKIYSIILFVKKNEEEIAIYNYKSEFIAKLDGDLVLYEKSDINILNNIESHQKEFRKFDSSLPDMCHEFIFDYAESKNRITGNSKYSNMISIESFCYYYRMLTLDTKTYANYKTLQDEYIYLNKSFSTKHTEIKTYKICDTRVDVLYMDNVIIKVN